MPSPTTELHFGPCRLRCAQRQLLIDGEPAKLGARAFDVLLALAERRERVVSKNELLEIVWPKLIVEENNLQVQISALRKLLGPQVISTIPGRGYRFTAALADTVAADAALARPPEAPPPAARFKTNLPERPPPLIGRDDDLAALRTLIDEHPLVTITGAGGIGKTLLAQHLIARQHAALEHGVCWVELATIDDAAALAPTIAAALGLRLGAGDPVAALLSGCTPLSLWLALDNAEHLVAEVAALAEQLLAVAPGLRLLVTSQAPLELAQERLYRLGSLDVPEHEMPASEALTYGAMALFAERARAADRHFKLDDANVAEVSAVCRQLDGSALAIELAAARLPLLGLHRLAASLDERLQLLTKGSRSAPRRQQTLRAALEWSHGLLNEVERIVFRRLAVVVGSATLELIQDVLADERMDRWQVLDALDALVDRSLVAVTSTEPPRYRLLESPRALAHVLLRASGEQAALSQRHAQAVVARFVGAKASARGVAPSALIAELEPDLGNARAALAWALQHDRASAVALAPGMAMVLGKDHFEELGAMWRATQACLGEDLPTALRAAWAYGAARHAHNRQPNEERELARISVALYRELDDPIGLYLALCGMPAVSSSTSDGDEARKTLDELRRLERADWPAGVRSFGAEAEFFVAYYAEDWPVAAAAQRRMGALGERAGSRSSLVTMKINLIDLTLIQGDAAEAVRLGRELERELTGSRSVSSLDFARLNLTNALLAIDDVVAARATAVLAWPTAQRLEAPWFWLDVLTLLAALEGRHRTAARLRGYADQGYAINHERRRRSELNSVQRAEALGRSALGETAFEQLRAEGKVLNAEQVADVVLASTDGPGVDAAGYCARNPPSTGSV